MTMSRSARITLLLVIDVLFFFIELIVGYAVGSLALVADSFHMLNDVMSLVVALYAIKLTNQNATDSRYSYGWHRAEILAALINGVFLLALCFSITLEALERFFSTPAFFPEISNPRLVVIVGSFGLASNIVGLFLFHAFFSEHSHSHDHSPSSSKPPSIHRVQSADAVVPARAIPVRNRSDSFSSLYGHPAATRASLVQTAQDIASSVGVGPTHLKYPTSNPRLSVSPGRSCSPDLSEHTPLLHEALDAERYNVESPIPATASKNGHAHAHGHGGSMNMRALLLHVLGDALGNVGVIATGLVIWLTNWPYKYYFDPTISLVITVIIFSSAVPLGRPLIRHMHVGHYY
ncbi:hypothetical protein ID866_4794 [Astraeus odoratus]|nr:hypothetical protein ID866_4794 [Astraeus odoratus]